MDGGKIHAGMAPQVDIRLVGDDPIGPVGISSCPGFAGKFAPAAFWIAEDILKEHTARRNQGFREAGCAAGQRGNKDKSEEEGEWFHSLNCTQYLLECYGK